MEASGTMKPREKHLKKLLAGMIFWFLGRGAQAVTRLDSGAAEELKELEEGFRVLLKVEPQGPIMSLTKKGGRLVFTGNRETDGELVIYFKSLEAALPVLTGRLGIASAFAEHRFMMKGDIALGMVMVRILSLVEAYLFPSFMTRRILKRMPVKKRSSLRLYLAVLFGI